VLLPTWLRPSAYAKLGVELRQLDATGADVAGVAALLAAMDEVRHCQCIAQQTLSLVKVAGGVLLL
jgi:hypothetical protein